VVGNARAFLSGVTAGARYRGRRSTAIEAAPPKDVGTVTVVIPTLRRPDYLARCLAGLAALDQPPDQIVVVRRDDDLETKAALAEINHLPVEEAIVVEPGIVAAMQAGAVAATCDIVAFTDDDAIPRKDWLYHLLAPFADPLVGAVGGRDVVHHADGIEAGRQLRVGLILPTGRMLGGHHLGEGVAREVQHVKGVNMAFRRHLITFPVGLRGGGAQVHNETGMCLHLLAQGLKVVYDPRAQVDHYPGPRFDDDSREAPSVQAKLNSAYNASYIIHSFWPHLRFRRLAYMLLVGDRSSPGLVRAAIAVAKRDRSLLHLIGPSAVVQVEAWRAGRRSPAVMHRP
jgi:GT2 family glycosyltransferase